MDKLKQLLESFIKISGLKIVINNLITINYNSNNNSPKIEAAPDGKVSINLTKLNPEEMRVAGEIAQTAHRELGWMGIGEDSEHRVTDFKESEARLITGGQPSPATFFEHVLPESELVILRAAQYLRSKFNTNSPDVSRIKADIVHKHGERASHICNLMTAGYFETLLMPMYEEMKKGGRSDSEFCDKFNLLVNDVPFAVFVNRTMSGDDVQRAIVERATKNIKYGVRKLAVHGIGKSNIERIRQTIATLDIPDHTFDIESEEYSNGTLHMRLIFAPLPA